MKKPGPRSLPIAEWPSADREVWIRALTPAVRLSRGGAASHLAQASRKDFEQRYGAYLRFLEREGLLDPSSSCAAYVIETNVRRYLASLQKRVGSVTICNCISKLQRVARILSPQSEFSWLVDIERDLKLVMEPRSKFPRVVSTPRLVRAGLKLMKEARGCLHRSNKRALSGMA